MQRPSLTRYAILSIIGAVLTIALKFTAYLLTGSVGLLSDAMESIINLLAAGMMLGMLIIATRPADDQHQFGHEKAEYFSSGAEGLLILITALLIGYTAIERFFTPQPIEQLDLGVGIAVVAALINLTLSRILMRAGRQYDSGALQADAQHLMVDVWTTAGVLIGLGAVALTDWLWLDPLIALAVAAHILHEGVHVLRKSVHGLMDTALPEDEIAQITQILDQLEDQGLHYHALRTRKAASRRFIDVHILVPGRWTVQQGHDLLEQLEVQIRAALPNTCITTHLEPIEDPASWQDYQPF